MNPTLKGVLILRNQHFTQIRHLLSVIAFVGAWQNLWFSLREVGAE